MKEILPALAYRKERQRWQHCRKRLLLTPHESSSDPNIEIHEKSIFREVKVPRIVHTMSFVAESQRLWLQPLSISDHVEGYLMLNSDERVVGGS